MRTRMVFTMVCLLAVLSLVSADPLWVRTHGNPFGGFDEVHAIGADDSGNVVISGLSDMSQDDEEFVTIKYKPNGDTAWLRHFNPGSGRDGATALAVDRSGNVIVTGYLGVSTAQYGDWVTIKYSAVGESLWAATWDHGDEDRPWSLVVDSAGNSYVAGTAGGLNDFDFAVVKYDPAGNEAWVFNYDGGLNDMATAVAVSRQGNTYATGFTVRSGIYGDLMTWKLGLGGESLWANTYEGPAGRHDRGQALAVDGLGDVFVTGTSQDANGREDFLTIKYAPNGDTVWTRRYNGAGNQSDQTTGLVLDAAGNAYVAGSSYADNNHYDYTTIKYAPDGTERWIAHYPGISHRAWAQAIALDADANVYVTGYSFDSLNNADVVTVKYDSAGTQRWAERYAGPYGEDEAYVLAVGPDSSVFVGGRTNSDSGGMDYLALRYGVAGAVAERSTPDASRFTPNATIVGGVLVLGAVDSGQNAEYGVAPSDGGRCGQLLDAAGRKVIGLRVGANDVSRLAPGVYFIRQQSAFSSQQSGREASSVTKVLVTR